MKTKIKIVVLIFLAFLASITVWKEVNPTKILFVNFRSWQVASKIDANDNFFIKLYHDDVRDGKVINFCKYDMVMFFGMGLHLNDEQKESIANAEKTAFYVYASSSNDNNLSTITGEKLKAISGYMENSDEKNTKELLNYIRREIDGKKWFTHEIVEAKEIPSNIFFHLDAKKWFADYEAYDKYYHEKGYFKENAPKVMIQTSNIGVQNTATAAPYVALIKALENQGCNVYAATGFFDRLDNIRKVHPDLLIYFAHGRLAMGKPDSALALLKELNIPLLSPLLVHENIDEWQNRQQGMMGGMLSQSIVAPELDGATVPFVLGGLETNDEGYDVFAPIPDRVETFAHLVKNQLDLKNKPNVDKKLAIVYYKGPGKNAMVAGGMEVAPSLLNLLKFLQEKGYETGQLPADSHELMEIIQAKGNVYGHYAKGAMDEFMKQSEVPMIPASQLKSWMTACFNENLIENVAAQYGECPGEYLVMRDSVENKLALPAIEFGNVVLLPQLMPALEGDEVSNIHGAKTAPPYSYIATYLYARKGFKADALIHFGTHGSLEFTPWKQTALSSNDWPDALIGDMPHFYIYTIGNIGEAMIAKRRGNAALVSHLTPPFQRSGLSQDMRKLHNLIHSLEKTQQPALIQQKYLAIRDLAVKIGLNKDLDIGLQGEISDEIVNKLHHYLHTIDSEKITEGLYTLGRSYSRQQSCKTVEAMYAEELGYNLAKLDLLDKKIKKEQLEDSHFMAEAYYFPASNYINTALSENRYPELVSDQSLSRYKSIKASGNYSEPGNLMAMMMAMGSSHGKKEDCNLDDMQLQKDIIAIAADKDKKDRLLGLKNEEKFQRMSALLDEESLEKARKMSKIIKAMKPAIEFFESEGVAEIIGYMNGSEANKTKVFQLLEDDKLAEKIEIRKQKNINKKLDHLNDRETVNLVQIAGSETRLAQFLQQKKLDEIRKLSGLVKEINSLPDEIRKHANLNPEVRSFNADVSVIIQKRIAEMENEEKEYLHAVDNIYHTVDLIKTTVKNLEESSEIEMSSLANALTCGFVPPSSGGDPIQNPYAVPTGRNLYGIDAKTTPGEVAWKAGKALVEKMLAEGLQKDGKYPRKVAFTLWGGEFIRDQGLTIAQILYLLGAEPVANSMGRVHDVRLIPLEKLGRPRIDVFVQTSGQFRDVAASRLFLIDKAVKLAAADEAGNFQNFVKTSTVAAEKVLKEKGFSPLEAQEFATSRIFGGTNGNYGTGIMGTVEAGDTYDSDTTIANQYIKNMGAIYTENHWGETRTGLFEAGAQHTDVIMHARSSNTHGPLSLDHVYEFMGGLNTAVKKVTGKEAEGFFVDYRNKNNPQIVNAKEAIWTEARSTILNKRFLEPLTKGEASSAEVVAEYTRNTFGWNATKASVIDEELWDKYHEVLVRDTFDLGMKAFFEAENPYALEEVTAVMLESVRKDFWHPSEKVVQELVDLHVKLVNEHGAGCSGFVCNNGKLRTMIEQKAAPEQLENYQKEINQTLNTEAISSDKVITLKKETISENLKNLAKENYLVIVVLVVILVIFISPFVFRRRQ